VQPDGWEEKVRIEANAALLQAMLAAPAARKAEGARFDTPAPAAAPQTHAPVAAPVQSVAMLVTLAAAGPEPERRREAARQAEEGLSGLEKLHKELIAGVASPQRLRSLRDWARTRGRPEEPELAALMDEIELRILVELAKRER
jgi:hypothetical protein